MFITYYVTWFEDSFSWDMGQVFLAVIKNQNVTMPDKTSVIPDGLDFNAFHRSSSLPQPAGTKNVTQLITRIRELHFLDMH